MSWCKICRNIQHLHPSMCLTSRILWGKIKSQHLWVLSTKYDGPTAWMWPNAPKTIPSWIPQTHRGNQG
jgi:hypothetical protein